TILEKLHLEKYIETEVSKKSCCCCCKQEQAIPEIVIENRWKYAGNETKDIFKSVFPYILLGVGIGAFIHNWIPANWVETVLGGKNPFGVILGVIVGTPMYADIFGTIPVAEALLGKGAQLGTILAFMMAVTTLSLPSIIMLRKVMKTPLLVIFTGTCVAGITIVGYLFNIFQSLFI
ncbi:MAG: permease, partial [Lentisphaeria bacterium]|nr:permease [Lentisphaeria bacterium]